MGEAMTLYNKTNQVYESSFCRRYRQRPWMIKLQVCRAEIERPIAS